jgi:hypothetical protein
VRTRVLGRGFGFLVTFQNNSVGWLLLIVDLMREHGDRRSAQLTVRHGQNERRALPPGSEA